MTKTWYVCDSLGNIINGDSTITDKQEAIKGFKEKYQEQEDREAGVTLCYFKEYENEERCDLIEQLTAADIWKDDPVIVTKKTLAFLGQSGCPEEAGMKNTDCNPDNHDCKECWKQAIRNDTEE